MKEKLSVGDEIILIDMYKEDLVIGTKGTVKSITQDPFEKDNEIVGVEWNNGRTISILTKYDEWKKVKSKVQESENKLKVDDKHVDYIVSNRDVMNSFDMKYFKDYLKILRESGIVNMYGASNFLYETSEMVERFYGLNREDDESFQRLMEVQDETREKFISGLVKYCERKNIDLDDMNRINREAQVLSKKILSYYILFFDSE